MQISTTSRTDAFSIEVASDRPPADLLQEVGATGRITVGDFSESFHMDLSYWSIEEYERSWRDSIQVISTGRKGTPVSLRRSPIRKPVISSSVGLFIGEGKM
jgi:hypothetical protein